jgi:fatty-acyl-CoA synthase
MSEHEHEHEHEHGLVMGYQLTVGAILRRAEQLFAHKEIVTRKPDRGFHRYTYADLARRARQLASALLRLGLPPSARVATLCASHHEHLEAYYGVPLAGLVMHPLNPRLHADDLTYIAEHAGDTVLIVDQAFLGLLDAMGDVPFKHVVVVGAPTPAATGFEEFIATGEAAWQPADLDEHTAAFLGYTSGTTGRPKGVLFSHRAIALHAMASALNGALGFREDDVVMPVVPMFHAMAWGWPYTCALLGAKQVLPGAALDPESLLENIERERVTVTGGVPTVWTAVLDALDAAPDGHDTSALRSILIGGSATPPAVIEAYEQRHGIRVVATWGMTELCMGLISELQGDQRQQPPDVQLHTRKRQGFPLAFLEIRARGDEGVIPWDGASMGELEVRGPWVASRYADSPDAAARWTADGWFATGDIVTIDPRGCVEIQDRLKDLVKSGGEWISSSALESALAAHPGVAEAAVIAIPDDRWVERPMAIVALRDDSVTVDQLRAHLADRVANWWLPDRFQIVTSLPKTSVGKLDKVALRKQFAVQPAANDR